MFGPPPRDVSNLGTARIHREAELGKPPQWKETIHGGEPEWHRGRQYWSSSVSDSQRSHSGRNARAAPLCPTGKKLAKVGLAKVGLAKIGHDRPTTPECTIPPHLFRTLLFERLRLPLQITEDRCEGCHTPLDALGQHRAACMRNSRVKKRAIPTERTVARIF